jgi:hypothetical protein
MRLVLTARRPAAIIIVIGAVNRGWNIVGLVRVGMAFCYLLKHLAQRLFPPEADNLENDESK